MVLKGVSLALSVVVALKLAKAVIGKGRHTSTSFSSDENLKRGQMHRAGK